MAKRNELIRASEIADDDGKQHAGMDLTYDRGNLEVSKKIKPQKIVRPIEPKQLRTRNLNQQISPNLSLHSPGTPMSAPHTASILSSSEYSYVKPATPILKRGRPRKLPTPE